MWGVKNGPPYPLDAKTHARVKKQKSYKEGSLLDLDPWDKNYMKNNHYTEWYKSYGLHKLSKTLFEDTSDPIPMSVNPYVYNSYGMKFNNLGAQTIPVHKKKSLYEDKQFFNDKEYALDVDTISKRKPMKMPQYFDDDETDFLKNQLKKVNPGYKANTLGVTNNCAKCSATVTLMKMGYNQVQAGITLSGSACGAASQWFNGGEYKKTNDLNDIKEALEKAKPGSFGMLGCGRVTDTGERASGHAMSWTKTRNGKIRIEDGQDTRIYNSFDDVVKAQEFSSGTVATFSDLTNATPNWSRLASDGVVQLPGNAKIVDSYGSDNHKMFDWDIADAISKPSISRSTYSVFNTPMSVAREWDPDLDRD